MNSTQGETMKWSIFCFRKCNRMTKTQDDRTGKEPWYYSMQTTCKPTGLFRWASRGLKGRGKCQWQENTVTHRSLSKTIARASVPPSIKMNRIKRLLPKHCSIWLKTHQQDFYFSWGGGYSWPVHSVGSTGVLMRLKLHIWCPCEQFSLLCDHRDLTWFISFINRCRQHTFHRYR